MDKYVEEYMNKADWRVNENSNMVYSVSGLDNQLAGTVLAKYYLKHMPKKAKKAHVNHLMHIHDMSGYNRAYCAGWGTKDLLLRGLNVGTKFPTSAPAKHLSTAIEHLLNFTFIISGEFAGAQAFSSLDIYLAPYIKEDKLTYKEVKQQVQAFVFGLAQKYRSGLQSPFSNITLDLKPLGEMKNEKVIVSGRELDYTYSECQPEIDKFNLAFCEVMSNGDSMGKPFAFPIPTYSITEEFSWDGKVSKAIFDMAIKTGVPYFSNFLNSDLDPEDVRSMCCRLRLDKRELINNGGGFFGSGDKTGSLIVVTLNLPRLAYMATNPRNKQVIKLLLKTHPKLLFKFLKLKTINERFKLLIKETMLSAEEVMVHKRALVEKNLKGGLFPYTKAHLDDFSNHFNTFGLVGMNEALLTMGFEKGILNTQGKQLAEETLDFMLDNIKDFQEKNGEYYKYESGVTKGLLGNLEATPAESTGFKLAKYDNEYFKGKIVTSNGLPNTEPYYTNSTWIPQDDKINEDAFAILDHQDSLQKKYTSGTVQHIYTTGKLTWQKGRDIIKKACENYELPYLSLSPTITVCPIHGRLDGEYEFCPHSHTEEEMTYIKKMGGHIVQIPKEEE